MQFTDKQILLVGFVKKKHEGQKRKYTGEPYWVHPTNVAQIVNEFTNEHLAIEIALCHDLIEDTKCTKEDLLLHLINTGYSEIDSEIIANGVIELTDCFTKERYPRWNRDRRKTEEARRLSTISALAQTVKYADIIDNASTIKKHDPRFAKVYLTEKRQILYNMTKGNEGLFIKCLLDHLI